MRQAKADFVNTSKTAPIASVEVSIWALRYHTSCFVLCVCLVYLFAYDLLFVESKPGCPDRHAV